MGKTFDVIAKLGYTHGHKDILIGYGKKRNGFKETILNLGSASVITS